MNQEPLPDKDFSDFERGIHHRFGQVKLLVQALTHSSHANERPEGSEDNERLEFLGDAVLELCVSEELYRRFPQAREGHLTRIRSRLVNERSLAGLARELGLSDLVLLGIGEEAQGGRERNALLADALEAVIGAVFLDGGYGAAREVVLRLFERRFPATAEVIDPKDAKSRLQEMTQHRFGERPVYTLRECSGPEHEKVFEVELRLPDGTVFVGRGSSLKKAEQSAASTALACPDEG